MEKGDPEKRAMGSSKEVRDLGGYVEARRGRSPALLLRILFAFVISCIALWLSGLTPQLLRDGPSFTQSKKADQCHQVSPLTPKFHTPALDKMDEGLGSEAFMNTSIQRLSSVVQIPTESFDDMGPLDSDKRWEVFFSFASLLYSTFPLIHSSLQLEKVNTHGLLYTWQGTDTSKKPLVLMAHQDVVPVPHATVSSWTHPPFSGFFDGKYVWGRGASDCKNQLIAIMSAIEALIAADFTPQRTVLLSFGFDEEISGREGAGHLSQFLLSRYGQNGVAAIVDEGAGFATSWGSTFATPGVGEKGESYFFSIRTI